MLWEGIHGAIPTGVRFSCNGAFHNRYYVTELVNGKPERVQKSVRLCSKDDKHHSTTCKAVQEKAADVMKRVNSTSGAISEL